MAISRSCIKRWRSTCEIVFHCIFWLKFCNLYMKLAVSHSCSTNYKKGVLKKFSKLLDKLKKQSSGGFLSKDGL